jgi:hypothetical protein
MEDGKIFSFFYLLVRLLVVLLISFILPVLFFVTFIFIEPREVDKINEYIENVVKTTNIVQNISYESAKIGINKNFEFVYDIKDLEFKIKNTSLKFPKITLKLKIFDLIRKRLIISEVNINDLVGYINYNTENVVANDNFHYNKLLKIIHNFISYSHTRSLVFENIKIVDNNFYFFNKDTST